MMNEWKRLLEWAGIDSVDHLIRIAKGERGKGILKRYEEKMKYEKNMIV